MKTDNHVTPLLDISSKAYMTFNEHTGKFTVSVISPYNRVMYVFLTDIDLRHCFDDDEYDLYLEMVNNTLYNRRNKDNVNQFVLLTQSGDNPEWVFKFGLKTLITNQLFTNASYFFLKEIHYLNSINLSDKPNMKVIGLSLF